MSKTETLSLIVIPFVVSIVANMFTPTFQRLLAFVAIRSVKATSASGIYLLKVREKQILEEISEIRELSSNIKSLLDKYENAVFFMGFSLWVLLLAPLFGLAAGFLLHSFLPDPFGRPIFIAIGVCAGVVGAGPLQAALYSIFSFRRVRRLKSPDAAIEKLSEELAAVRKYLEPDSVGN